MRPSESKLRPSPGSKVGFADSLRGIAAISVVLCHFTQIYWDRASQAYYLNVEPLPAAYVTPSLVTWLSSSSPIYHGAFGVALFFLISGFVIPFAFQRYTARGFLLGRALRLYPTYAAGFTISVAAAALGSFLYGKQFPHTIAEVGWQYALGLRDIVGSKNIDGVIWTLEIEIKFYLVCACLSPLFRVASPRVLLAPAAVICGCLLLVPLTTPTGNTASDEMVRLLNLAAYEGRFVIFMFIGVTINLHFQRAISNKAAVTATGAFLGAFLLLHVLTVQAGDLRQPLQQAWGYILALGVFVVSYSVPAILSGALARPLSLLSRISYPLYVAHLPLGMLILRQLHGSGASYPSAFAVALTAVLLVSYGLHLLVEQPTQRWGRRLAEGLGTGALRRQGALPVHEPIRP